MMRLFTAGCFWLAVFSLLDATPAGVDRARPNIVVFIADDHSQRDCAPYGATDVRTPNLARLAAAGMTFTHAFVASPSCAPSRAALLTGLMPARNGAEANHSKPRAELKKLPAYLRDCGYDVAAFGKVAHYGQDKDFGFDHYDQRHAATVVGEYLQARKRERPLCLFVGTHHPHVPWSETSTYDPREIKLPPGHVDTPETREFRTRYYTDVTKADRELGEIEKLVREQLGENTLLIFTSDHGAQWPFGKWNLYDAGIRVPMIAVWPGVIGPATKTDAMVSWVDLLPTFVELGGGDAGKEIDGRSFAGVLLGKTNEHRELIFSTHSGDGRVNVYPIRSVRTRRYKYIRNLHPEFRYTTHIDLAQNRDGVKYWRTWEEAAKSDAEARRIVERYRRRPREEFYDLQVDPFERNNVVEAVEHRAELERLRRELDNWMKAQGDRETVFAEPRILKAD